MDQEGVRSYLQTWTDGVAAAREGAQLEYAGSNQYPGLGVERGDVIYVAYLESRRLHLIGRLPVAEVIDHDEATRRRGSDIWDAIGTPSPLAALRSQLCLTCACRTRSSASCGSSARVAR